MIAAKKTFKDKNRVLISASIGVPAVGTLVFIFAKYIIPVAMAAGGITLEVNMLKTVVGEHTIAINDARVERRELMVKLEERYQAQMAALQRIENRLKVQD